VRASIGYLLCALMDGELAGTPFRPLRLHRIYRLQIHLDKGRVPIRTRTGLDWTKRFSAIAAAFDIPVDRAIFDGEVVAVKDGRTNFSELQAALAAGRQEALTFNVFDLLFLEGFDLRDSPLIERKRILKELLEETGVSGPILYADHLVSDGPRLFAHACKLGFEGIISKKADAPCRSEPVGREQFQAGSGSNSKRWSVPNRS
jgi:bifunctional non-homologous end joining protein LigD